MKNRPEVQQENPILLWDHIEDHPAVIWLTQNYKNIGYAILGLLFFFLLAARLGWISSGSSEMDYAQASAYYNLFSKNPANESGKDALNKLAIILKKHPELHAKYDGLVAQNLIIAGNGAEAGTYLTKALKRTTDKNAPLYADFSRTTLLISNNKLEEALDAALKLKTASESDPLLYANNLLIIASLQQKLNHREAETETWKELKNYINRTTIDTSAIQKFKSLFVQGNVNLDQYIDERIKE